MLKILNKIFNFKIEHIMTIGTSLSLFHFLDSSEVLFKHQETYFQSYKEQG